ncbi:efflux RND transporter periplasmic adaptor subunit [Pseudomonas sp. C9]|uniref:efflux RND transporter periplasmic adaptor subunit n=1 Tax=Pseudomonas TaxID=286 RepID=UPI001C83905A
MDILVPEWVAAQTEFLVLKRSDLICWPRLVSGYGITGMPATLIAQVERGRFEG